MQEGTVLVSDESRLNGMHDLDLDTFKHTCTYMTSILFCLFLKKFIPYLCCCLLNRREYPGRSRFNEIDELNNCNQICFDT